jgi:hypothetical protein
MSALFLGILRGVLRSKQALDVERLQEAGLSHSRASA